MDEKKTLAVAPCSTEQAVHMLSVLFMQKKTDTCGGLASAAEQLSASQCYAVKDSDGGEVGYYAVQTNKHKAGDEVVLVAGVGTFQGTDLTLSIVPFVAEQAAQSGAKALTVHTRRRGMVKKLALLGFECEGFILRKRLNT